VTGPRAQGALHTVLAVLYIFLWASAFVPSRVVSTTAPPLWILSFRFTLAGALLLGGALAAGLALPRDPRTWGRLALLGLTANAGYLGLTYLALRHLSSGMGAILASTNPLLLALAAPRLLGEPLTRRKLLGMVLGVSGVVITMAARAGLQTARPQDVALALGGVVSLTASTILYKRLQHKPHPIVVNGGQLLCAGLILVPAALLMHGAPRVMLSPQIAVAFAWLVVAMSIGASLLWFWLLSHGDASRVSAWYFLTPVFGLLLGAALLGEKLAPLDGVGLVVIAAGLLLVTREKPTSAEDKTAA
jgi:drug/metabolite transporter (DMT)-like permease